MKLFEILDRTGKSYTKYHHTTDVIPRHLDIDMSACSDHINRQPSQTMEKSDYWRTETHIQKNQIQKKQ